MKKTTSVIWNQKMEGWFVLFDFGEAPDGLAEAVISSVVIHQRDLSHQDAAFRTPELMVEAGGEGDAFSRTQHHRITGLQDMTQAIGAYRDVGIG
jgi:hypothetical protein